MGADESWEEIARFSRLYGMDPLLIRAVAEVESGNDPLARSPRRARGLMQLMPATLREMNVRDPWDREENLEAGIRYLRRLLDRFDGNLVLALAAYNAGPRRVRQYRGVPPFRETRTYVRRVLALYRKFQRERNAVSGALPEEETG
ncbi:MAG: lytic transglycosylase domain-containing protein [Nitrospinota bacterium]